MGYPTIDTTDDFPALPVPTKRKQQPTESDFPILKKKEVGISTLKTGGQVGTSVPQLEEPNVSKLRNLSDISVSPQQQQDIKEYLEATSKENRAKVDNSINTTTDIYRAANKLYTGKENEFQNEIPEGKAYQNVKNFLNDPNVIEKAKTDPKFATKYKEAKFNIINDFPNASKADIEQTIGQHLENKHKTGILYNNPGKHKVDEAVDELAESNELDPHQVYKYKQDIRPDVGTFKSAIFGSPIQTADYINTISKSLERNGGNIVEGIRDAADKLSFGTISKFGEGRAEHQKRVLNDISLEPQVEPSGEGKKFGLNVADMVGFVLPAVLGEFAGVPAMATLGTQFYGQNKKDGMQLYQDNENKQDAYAALTTGIDLIVGGKLPIKGIGESIRGLVDEAAAGAITKYASKNKYFGFINDALRGGIQGANVLEVMKIGHNAANAVFGGRNFNLEEQAKEALRSYPQDVLAMSLFKGVGAAAKNLGKTEAPEPEIKPEEQQQKLSAEQEIINKALANNEITGMNKIGAEEAVKDPEASKKFVNEISDQVNNKVASQFGSNEEMATKMYGKTLVDHVKENVISNETQIKADQGLKPELNESQEKQFKESKYSKVSYTDLSGESKNVSARNARRTLEKRHDVLSDLIKCLTV